MKSYLAKAILGLALSPFLPQALLAQDKAPVSSSINLNLYGALTGGYIGYTNGIDNDSFTLTNLVIGLQGEEKGSLDVSFDIAIGGLSQPTFWNTTFPIPQSFDFNTGGVNRADIGILWSYLTLKPSPAISLDLGLMPTNIGYEVANTYANPNINLGAVWFAQPVIYPALRATVTLGGINLYAEYNQEFGGDNFAVGSLGELGPVSFAVSYYDYKDDRNIVDIVGSTSLGMLDLGVNFDYQWLDNPSAGQDSYAYGVALYVTPSFGDFKIPVRGEYFDEGTSQIYSGASAGNGYTFTVTPTFKPSKNSFIRGEVAYITTNGNVFKGGTKNNRTILALEVGFTF